MKMKVVVVLFVLVLGQLAMAFPDPSDPSTIFDYSKLPPKGMPLKEMPLLAPSDTNWATGMFAVGVVALFVFFTRLFRAKATL